MTNILDTIGTEKYVFEEAITDALSAKWVERVGVRTEVLGLHLEAACKRLAKTIQKNKLPGVRCCGQISAFQITPEGQDSLLL